MVHRITSQPAIALEPIADPALPAPAYLAPGRGSNDSPGAPARGAIDVERQGGAMPAGVGSVALRDKLIASLKGTVAGGLPAAALNVAATAVGTMVFEGRSFVGDAVKSSGATAGLVLAVDLGLTVGVAATSHYSGLDNRLYKNETPDEMLEKKTVIAGVLSAVAGGGVTGLATAQWGRTLTHQAISAQSVGRDRIDQAIGTGFVHGAIGLAGLATALYKRKPKADPDQGD